MAIRVAAPQLLAVVAGRLGIKDEGVLADTDVVVVRKSFDARTKKVIGWRKVLSTVQPPCLLGLLFLAFVPPCHHVRVELSG